MVGARTRDRGGLGTLNLDYDNHWHLMIEPGFGIPIGRTHVEGEGNFRTHLLCKSEEITYVLLSTVGIEECSWEDMVSFPSRHKQRWP